MRDGNQNESSAPSLVAQPQNLLNNTAWAATSAKFDKLQNDYDHEYENATKELYEIADLASEIHTKRSEDVNALRQQNQQWVDAVKQVQKAASDTTALDMRRREMEQLEITKRALLEQFVRGDEENKELEKKLNNLDLPKLKLRQVDQAVRQKKQHELPTLEFTLKVLKSMSRSYLSETTDPTVIEGYIVQEEKNDVRPFRFNDETPVFERVNFVWDSILQDIDTESPRETN